MSAWDGLMLTGSFLILFGVMRPYAAYLSEREEGTRRPPRPTLHHLS